MSTRPIFKCAGKNKYVNINVIKNNHKALFYCEYCDQPFVENVFKVTRQSQRIWKLMNRSDPISQHTEPKISCNACYTTNYNIQTLIDQRKLKNLKSRL